MEPARSRIAYYARALFADLSDAWSRVGLQSIVLGNTVLAWAVAAAIAVAAFLGLWAVRGVVVRRLLSKARQENERVIDLLARSVRKTYLVVLLVAALYAGSLWLVLPEKAVTVRDAMVRVVLLVQVAIWANAFIGLWAQRHRERNLETDKASVTTMNAAAFLLRVALFSVVLVLALDNAGFEVNALLASLGVAGIAVALAVQTIVADIFASLSISLDKPFVIGDFIIVDKHLGVVEYVGLKTTRIRSLWGEQLVFSNNDLLNARIQNYGKMQERRVAFTFGVLYQTTPEQLEAIPPMVKEVIEGIELTRFDRAHFFKFGDSSYDFEVVYYIGSADYNLYMDIQQTINLGIVRGFAKRGIEFAYPTRTVYVQGGDVPENAGDQQPAQT